MQPPKFIQHLMILLCALVLSACVSVNIKPDQAKKAEGYQFQIPQKPFQKISTDNADHAWQSKSTGNTIALMTECSKRDPSLTQLKNEVVQALSESETVSEESTQHSNRAALKTLSVGYVDGVKVFLDVLVFKKNACLFTASYIGRDGQYDKESASFQSFLQSLSVP